MKNKILTIMLFAVIVAMMLSGCGNSAESGGRVEETYYSDGSPQCRVEYDANGNETKEILYNPDGSIFRWTEIKYDATGNAAEVTAYNPDGSLSNRSECEYDADGNITKQTQYNPDGSIME